jgi:inhibitor of KinA sporulation pathway (predicted exonuclease)
MFETQCASFYVPYPFSSQHVNLKALFAEAYKRGSKVKPVGMLTALRMAKLNLQGTHHRGGDDAWNIARLLGHMIHKRGVALLDPYWDAVAADG